MPLTDIAIRKSKPSERAIKLFDGNGLFLLVNPNGSRWWRFKYRFGGKEKLLSLGVFPEVSLKQARDRRDDARRLIADGSDPSVERRAEKAAQEHTFELIAREWMQLQEGKLAPVTANKTKWVLETFIFPSLGSRPVAEIRPRELLEVLRKVETKGMNETARRCRQKVSQVLRYAIATGDLSEILCFEAYHDLQESICRERRSRTSRPRHSLQLSRRSRRSCSIS